MALPYLATSGSTSPKGKREKAVCPPIVVTDSLHYEKISSVQLQQLTTANCSRENWKLTIDLQSSELANFCRSAVLDSDLDVYIFEWNFPM